MEQIRVLQITPDELEALINNSVKNSVENSVKSVVKEIKNDNKSTEYMTRKDVCDMLHINLATLHRYTKAGKLKSYGIGSRVLYRRDEVESVIIQIQ